MITSHVRFLLAAETFMGPENDPEVIHTYTNLKVCLYNPLLLALVRIINKLDGSLENSKGDEP